MREKIDLINFTNYILDKISECKNYERGDEVVIVDDVLYQLTVNDLTDLNKHMNQVGYDLRLRNWALYIYKF
jgi:hypothetical protein